VKPCIFLVHVKEPAASTVSEPSVACSTRIAPAPTRSSNEKAEHPAGQPMPPVVGCSRPQGFITGVVPYHWTQVVNVKRDPFETSIGQQYKTLFGEAGALAGLVTAY
jgi:hypothetical protein